MHETNSTDEIAELLHTSYGHALSGTIAIDGRDGVGKTTLAGALQKAIGGTVISLDDFVPNNCGGYIPYLKTVELRAALETSSRPRIVEGVCVLAALQRVSYEPNVLIYIKRLANYGYWHEENTWDPTEPVEELIARLNAEVASFARLDAELSGEPLLEGEKPRLTPLREEIIRYHALYRPSRSAAIIFLRVEHD